LECKNDSLNATKDNHLMQGLQKAYADKAAGKWYLTQVDTSIPDKTNFNTVPITMYIYKKAFGLPANCSFSHC